MRFNVLVVDDNAVMRTVITRTLKMSGIPLGELHRAADGVEALDVLSRSWVDLACGEGPPSALGRLTDATASLSLPRLEADALGASNAARCTSSTAFQERA